jgi:hypothetical protein
LSEHLDLNFDLVAMRKMKSMPGANAMVADAAPLPASEEAAAAAHGAGTETDLPDAPAPDASRGVQASNPIPPPALRPASFTSTPTSFPTNTNDLARQSPAPATSGQS